MTRSSPRSERPLPCPFCSATPHRGLTKPYADQLHGELLQHYRIWCPHDCASKRAVNEDLAIAAWNTRAPTQSSAEIKRPVQGWEVEVRINGTTALTIGHNHLSGMENIDEFADEVETCARHLLSFIGRCGDVAQPPQDDLKGFWHRTAVTLQEENKRLREALSITSTEGK